MNSILHIPTHEPLSSLPAHTTLRQIALRAKQERMRQKQLTEGMDPTLQDQVAIELAPKHEISLCTRCTVSLKHADYATLAQIWGCLRCGRARGWGYAAPEDPQLRPALTCGNCETHTRHGFVGVIGRSL